MKVQIKGFVQSGFLVDPTVEEMWASSMNKTKSLLSLNRNSNLKSHKNSEISERE